MMRFNTVLAIALWGIFTYAAAQHHDWTLMIPPAVLSVAVVAQWLLAAREGHSQ
jgi:hypothetical protein